MGATVAQRIVDALPLLDRIADDVQPRVQRAVEAGGTRVRNILDGTWMETPLHPALTDVPIGSWTAALLFDGLDAVSDSRAMRNAADATLALGVVGAAAAAVVGFSDWRYLQSGSRRMGTAHALLNSVALTLSIASLLFRATGRRNAGRLAFLTGYSMAGMGAHLGGELSYGYGLRVNRNIFQQSGPHDFLSVLKESELPEREMRRVSANGAEILLSRSSAGEILAISNVCGHFGGSLVDGRREDDSVVCPLHGSRFDLRTGEAIDGPALFPQPRYETRIREGNIEIRAVPDNVQEKIT